MSDLLTSSIEPFHSFLKESATRESRTNMWLEMGTLACYSGKSILHWRGGRAG